MEALKKVKESVMSRMLQSSESEHTMLHSVRHQCIGEGIMGWKFLWKVTSKSKDLS
jgi:hypothetical protein